MYAVLREFGPESARRVLGEIVGAREDVDDGGPQSDDVLLESHQHLRRGLPTDAAIQHLEACELQLVQVPALCNRVSDEDHARGRGARRR
jgi:hypothetical protein